MTSPDVVYSTLAIERIDQLSSRAENIENWSALSVLVGAVATVAALCLNLDARIPAGVVTVAFGIKYLSSKAHTYFAPIKEMGDRIKLAMNKRKAETAADCMKQLRQEVVKWCGDLNQYYNFDAIEKFFTSFEKSVCFVKISNSDGSLLCEVKFTEKLSIQWNEVNYSPTDTIEFKINTNGELIFHDANKTLKTEEGTNLERLPKPRSLSFGRLPPKLNQ